MARIAPGARPFLASALALVVAAAPCHAQTPTPGRTVAPGDEVRVSWRDASYDYAFGATTRVATAEVAAFDGTHLMLRRGGRVFTVPMASVRTLQRRTGTKPATAPEMVAGSAGGFAVGFLAGLLTGGIEGGGASIDRVDAGVTTAVLIGAPMGALIAWAASRSRGIYETVPFGDLVSGLVVDADGRVGIRVPVGNR